MKKGFARAPLFAPLLCLALGACPLDDDPGFDDWCGDHLCHWTLVDGSITKVPTWHDRDYGVELDGSHVTLTQQPDIKSVGCLEFKVIADIDPTAAVFVELDFRADGTIDYREQLPSAKWQPLTFLVHAPSWYDALALTVTKESDGHAVLARLELGDGQGCTGPPIPLDDRPAGAKCESGDQCTSGTCAPPDGCMLLCDAGTPCSDAAVPCVGWPAICH